MAEEDKTPKALWERSIVFFVIGVVVAAVVGFIGFQKWLADLIDDRISAKAQVLIDKRIDDLKMKAGSIPSGLVIASLTECRDLKGGWMPFNAAGGRFIIGAGAHPTDPVVSKNYEGYDETNTPPRTGFEPSKGGTESVYLSDDYTPEVYTTYALAHVYRGESELRFISKIDIASQSVKNLKLIPPYIALYYCKKE